MSIFQGFGPNGEPASPQNPRARCMSIDEMYNVGSQQGTIYTAKFGGGGGNPCIRNLDTSVTRIRQPVRRNKTMPETPRAFISFDFDHDDDLRNALVG